MTVVRSLADVPEFGSEAEEAEFWSTHEIGADVLDQMKPVPKGVLPPPDRRPRPS